MYSWGTSCGVGSILVEIGLSFAFSVSSKTKQSSEPTIRAVLAIIGLIIFICS
jgi:hypothetical protein